MTTIEDLVESAVGRGVQAALAAHLPKLTRPEPITYTKSEAALVIGCSDRTLDKWIADGTIPRVANIEGRVLLPRIAVEAYALGLDPHEAVATALHQSLARLQLVTDEVA